MEMEIILTRISKEDLSALLARGRNVTLLAVKSEEIVEVRR